MPVPPPAVYQLLGVPGTGKYTVARALVGHLEAAGRTTKLLDNHASANLIFDLVPLEERLSPSSMTHVRAIRTAVIAAIDELSPPDWSFVFTSWIPATAALTTVERHRELAARRGVPFVVVVLTCERQELLRRVPGADRAERLKLVDPDRAAQLVDEGPNVPSWPGVLHLDVTSTAPADAAAWIAERTPASVDR